VGNVPGEASREGKGGLGRIGSGGSRGGKSGAQQKKKSVLFAHVRSKIIVPANGRERRANS
jgi:hypothetical protein